MKNILSILSLSLVILIGYSEESISQVNEANNPKELPHYSSFYPSEQSQAVIKIITEELIAPRVECNECAEKAYVDGSDYRVIYRINLINFLISELRNYYRDYREGCSFVADPKCANVSNAVIDDQMILQNVENNIDRLSPP